MSTPTKPTPDCDLVAGIADFLARLEADCGNTEVFPRPCQVDINVLRAVAMSGNREGITTDEIADAVSVCRSRAERALGSVAGLMAIHRAPIRLQRKRKPGPGLTYVYYLARA